MIAERTPEESRAEALAKVMGFFSIGVLAGPVFGGFLRAPLGSSGVCFAACGLTAVNVAWAFFQLEEVQSEEREASQNETVVNAASTNRDPIMQAIRMVWQRPALIVVLACTFLQTSVVAVFMGTGAWYNLQEYGFSAWQNGLLIAIGGGTMLFCQFNLTGPAVKRFTELGCIWISSGVRCMSLLVYAFAPPSTNPLDMVPYVCATALFATMALVDPSLQTLTVKVSPANSIGTVMGIGQALRSGGEAFGPAIAGYAYEIDERLPWLIAAVCAILGGMLYVESQPDANDVMPSLLTKQACTSDDTKCKPTLEEPLLSA
jgi:Na+/melibiose symporter-like transporter